MCMVKVPKTQMPENLPEPERKNLQFQADPRDSKRKTVGTRALQVPLGSVGGVVYSGLGIPR
jgi:hypothetical protein